MYDFDFRAVITDYGRVFHGLYMVDEGDVIVTIEINFTHQLPLVDVPDVQRAL